MSMNAKKSSNSGERSKMGRAIVIGASSGIGREVAKLLMADGWTVGVAARRVELLQTLGATAVEQIDVTSETATERLRSLILNTNYFKCIQYRSK